MNKEAKEKIARILAKYLYGDIAEWKDLTPDGKVLMLYKAGEILKAIGYYKLPKEEPPIGYKALRDWIRDNLGAAVLESYESSVIKHYENPELLNM